MIISGFFLSIASGLTLPMSMVLFGDIVNNFLYQYLTTYIGKADNETVATYVQSTAFSQNVSCTELNDSSLLENITNSSILLCGLNNKRQYEEIIAFACDPNARLQSEIGIFSLYFVALGAVALVAGFLGALFWNISAYRQTRRIRESLYQSILRQEVGWFDVNNATELNTRLIE